MLKFTRIFAAAAALAFVAPAVAGDLAAPAGPVILTITGNITNTNVDGTAQFDLAMLEGLEQGTTVTATPWYEGPKSFTGPLLSAVLKAAGADGTMMTVLALNDYATEIPISDVTSYPVILASRLDGEELSVRDKGPLFVIYPFDLAPELYNEVYFGRSAWQVKSIEIK
jgi:hypothetical protein